MELALLHTWREGLLPLPVVTVDFAGNELERVLNITSLEAPHRIADARTRL
jgi:CRISPR-associated protein Csb1